MRAAETAGSATIDTLEALYQFREPDEVRAYLARNPDLIDLLVDASTKIPEFLPTDGSMILEVVWDPDDEEEEENDELVAVVPTRLKWDEVRPRLDRLTREWLIPTARFAAGRFIVDVEYR
jgi:hypothetical protein